MELKRLLEEVRIEEERLAWEGSFAEYLEMATKKPALARLSHARIYDSIMAAGTERGRLGETGYKLFSGEIFGVERALQNLVSYFASAARRLEVRKRILLLLGPVASGKSTIVALLKKGLEEYSRTDAGAVYAIKGCPMQEEPLHLIPPKLRPALEKEYGLYIEGDLCPRCRFMLQDRYQGRTEEVRVRRVALSERDGVGIGTFIATDPQSQDLSRLVGSIDLAALGEDRLEAAGRAYRLDGELNVANRGLMEFIEIFKSDEKFLSVLLTLTQEQSIKTGRFGTIYADEAIISHSNEAEYNAFVTNKKSEALQDRIIVVRIPYNLKVSDEVRIYEKLLRESDLAGMHFAPLTLRVASTFAVLSRLQPSKKWGMSLTNKLKLYDGELVEDFTPKDVADMQEEAPQEGMEGISPRFVINRISSLVVKDQRKCVEPLGCLQALWEGIEQSTTLAREQRERLFTLFSETRSEYDAMAKLEVQRACVDSFTHSATRLFQDYVREVEAFCTGQEVVSPASGEALAPDERLMRSLEEGVGIREHAKGRFRQEIWERFSSLTQQGLTYDYTTDARLKTAIEKRLLPDLKQVARILAAKNMEAAQQREALAQRLIGEHGYCSLCAKDLMDYVHQLLTDRERPRHVPRSLRWLWG